MAAAAALLSPPAWRRRLALLGLLLPLLSPGMAVAQERAAAALDDPVLVEQGRRMYVEGMLPGGTALQATRSSGDLLQGRDAACIRCHRASGMGSVEGNLRVAPISSRFMFAQRGDMPMANADGIRGKSLSQAHEPYTEESLALALRSGVNSNGRALSVLMPHYELAAGELSALKAYLSVLSRDYSVGVSKEVIRFATVITPDVAPERRAVFKEMLRSAVMVKNTSTSPRKRYMTSAASFVTQSERRWDVEIWELSGPASTWGAQMAARYEAKPVFALLSGLSEGSWAPVDAFCTSRHIPCWFPSVKAPMLGESAYGLYFNNGLVQDAQVLAAYLQQAPRGSVKHVTQVFAPGSTAEAAAAAFRLAMDAGQTVNELQWADAADRKLASLLRDAPRNDALVLWLGPEQLLPLLNAGNAPQAAVYIASPLWSDADLQKVPPAWHKTMHIIYPYELPQARQANLAYLHTWLKLRGIALVDEVMQSELFFSLNLMTDTLQDMIDNMFRDYLIERTEDNIGKRETSKAEQENHDRKALGRVAKYSVVTESGAGGTAVTDAPDAQAAQRRAFAVGESYGTTVYPRLTLAPGQNFASRGAYVMSLHEFMGPRPMEPSNWIVP